VLVIQYNELIDAPSAGRLTDGKKPAIPCGACRQVLAEFNPNMKIPAATIDGKMQEFDLAELLPFPSQGILEGSRDV
jgi:cytidine deaminase